MLHLQNNITEQKNRENVVSPDITMKAKNMKDVTAKQAVMTGFAKFFLYAFLIFFVLNLLPLASFNEELIKALMKEESFSLLMILLLAIGSSLCSLMIFLTESKTHIKAICRDCGNLWNLN